ncbi:MAG: outer membrane protein assembly factor BamD [Candidatus Krumholzibacteriia bacterium]
MSVLAVLAAALALVGAGLAGCGSSNPYPPGSYRRAVHFYENEDFREAAASFDVYVRQNPTDSLAVEAQYLKAMSYLETREYPLAAVEFKILRQDYPTSPRAEDAAFMEAVASFREVGRVERDITGAKEARRKFLEFSRRYPDSAHQPEVRDYLQQISDLSVRKRMNAVDVYLKLGRPDAASVTLDAIIADEPGSSLLDRVLARRAEVALRLGDEEAARIALQRLLREFPDSPRADDARRRLGRLDGEPETALDAGS